MRSIVAFSFLSCVLFSGCQFLGVNPSGGRVDHRRVWNAASDGTYSYVVDRYCFCIPSGRFKVKVVDYTIQSVVYAETDEAIPPGEYEYIHTIEQLFDLIDEARTQGAYKLDVEYAAMGYPTLVDIDWIEEAVDDEIYYGVLEVTLDH